MADYAVANLKELENSAERFGLAPDVEARFARTALDAEETGLSYQRLAPGARYPFGHRHADQEEIYVVLSGGGRVKLGDEVVDVRPWDAIRVAPARDAPGLVVVRRRSVDLESVKTASTGSGTPAPG